MKILKFRIYDKTERRMKYLDNIWNMPDPGYDFDEVQQFTGLLDCHGKEIYEGDIINFQMTGNVLVDHRVMVATTEETAIYQGAVKWGKYGWQPFINGKCSDVEIIGNIWENPDLRKL